MRARCLLAAAGLASAASVPAAPVELSAGLWSGMTARVEVLVGDTAVCTLQRADAASDAEPTCRFELPLATARLRLRGEYATPKDGGGRLRHAGERAIALLDFAPVSRELDATQRPYGERVAAFLRKLRAFERQQRVDAGIGTGTPETAAAIAAAEQRLGYALPPELASLLRTVGAIEVGDHSMTAAASLRDGYSAIVKDWGTPEAAMAEDYGPRMQTFLKASTLLFTEVGDGLGGLLYRPPPTKACGERGIYYWTSQESGDENLSANGACPDFAGAFRWLLEGFAIGALADDLADERDVVLIDTATGTQPLKLQFSDEPGFAVGLARRWNGPH